jgi:hypothetical protein
MRDLLVLHEPAEIMEHVHALWQTDLFRESHEDSYGYIRHWVTRMAQLPRAFYEMTHPEVEHSNFTVLYGALHRRTYAKPAVHDLFVLHEMIHMVGLADSYDPEVTWEQWARKVIHNEERTALESEVVVYFELPHLRALSFDFPIWADQFLGRPMRPRMELYGLRRQAMSMPRNEIERQMAGYPHQNQQWADVWRHRWAEPERAMRQLVRDVATDRRAAAARYRSWLTEETGITPARPYPFPDEAEAFARIFHANRRGGVIPPDTGSGDAQPGLRLVQQQG